MLKIISHKKLMIEKMIPYCANCSRKTTKEGMPKTMYYCDVVSDSPMKGIVTLDTDGTHCVERGLYFPIHRDLSHINIE